MKKDNLKDILEEIITSFKYNRIENVIDELLMITHYFRRRETSEVRKELYKMQNALPLLRSMNKNHNYLKNISQNNVVIRLDKQKCNQDSSKMIIEKKLDHRSPYWDLRRILYVDNSIIKFYEKYNPDFALIIQWLKKNISEMTK